MKKKKEIKKENLNRKVEVDVSGAVAQTAVASVFAYSNGKNYSILISSKIKRLALEHFRLFSEKKFHKTFYFKLYISGLIILFSSLSGNYDIVLDTELYGQDENIKGELKKILENKVNLSFKQIGRKSPAHFLAKGVFLKKIQPNKIVTFVELKKYLEVKEKRSATPKVKATY